jgi:hypothetical protein
LNVSTIAARILLLVAGPWSRVWIEAGGEKEGVILIPVLLIRRRL